MSNPINPDLFSKALLQRAAVKDIRMSNLKLQKLAYYCQGHNLAVNNEPIFSGRITAWPHGPVVNSIYSNYSHYENRLIDVPCDNDYVSNLSQQALDMVDYVLALYGKIGAWALRNKTHGESPWKQHYSVERQLPDYAEITHEQMQDFFSQNVSEIQDKRLASVMDSLEDELIEVPESISNKDEFYSWIQAH